MYKLVNIKTQKERLCQKIQIENFDYYISDEGVVNPCYFYNKPTSYLGKALRREGNFWVCENIEGFHLLSEAKKIIATNNPNFDIPKVVDAVEVPDYAPHFKELWLAGYNKSQETHPFSEEDMIEFGKYCIRQFAIFQNRDEDFTKRILHEWKEQKPKIVYYE